MQLVPGADRVVRHICIRCINTCNWLPKATLLNYVWVIDQSFSVKMARYWPKSFFACLWTGTESRSINSQKKERGHYPAILTEKALSLKDLLLGFRGHFCCVIRRVVPSGQDSSILPSRVANHSARFGSSCPLTELAI